MSANNNKQLFTSIDDAAVAADDNIQTATEIESYCVNCEKNGITRLLLTVIPHFREVILMAFECPHCGFRNNEIQSGSAVQERGCMQQLKVKDRKDLNRQIVKSETALVKFVELDFEIPAITQRGSLTTLEGLITKAANDLEALQPQRKLIDEAIHDKIQSVIAKLQSYTMDPNENQFTVILDDPAGNSYIENLLAPAPDPQLSERKYDRTPEMNEAMGLSQGPAAPQDEGEEATRAVETVNADGDANPVDNDDDDDDFKVHIFHGNCSRCNAPSDTRMRILDIPYFKEVVIMATDCDSCGYKSNEVKAGGAISEQGKRITLFVEDAEDLSRDILKSETCGLSIPEIELELTTGTLGGRFTTVEGLLTQIKEELTSQFSGNMRFATGDSADDGRKAAFEKFLGKLDMALAVVDVVSGDGRKGYALILDDPLANSYLQNPYAPDEDPNMTIEFYDRTFEQNEFLGLNDMVLEGYENNV